MVTEGTILDKFQRINTALICYDCDDLLIRLHLLGLFEIPQTNEIPWFRPRDKSHDELRFSGFVILDFSNISF
jgi:hypothetical protein